MVAKQNILYSFCATLFIGAVAFAFLPHIIEHSHPVNAEEGKELVIDKNFIVSCPKIGKTININISSQGFEPKITTVHVCDQILFKNTDEKIGFQVAFGQHPDHLLYPGFIEQYMKPGATNSVILTAFGNYKIHDHLNDEIEGEIIAEK